MADEDPVPLLLAAADAAARGEPLPPAAARWLVRATRAYVNGEGPLDRCLGLSGGPGRNGDTRARLARRDAALREAGALVGGAGPLAEAIQRFESRRWPCWRDLDQAPARASEIECYLFEARRFGPLPGRRRLLDLCREPPGTRCTGGPVG
jgi:hypothetical protein